MTAAGDPRIEASVHNTDRTNSPRRHSHRQEDSGSLRQKDAGDPEVNVGDRERTVSVAAGAIAAAMGISRRTVPGYLVAGIGGALLYRGATGHCSLYEALRIDTTRAPRSSADRSVKEITEHGFRVQHSLLINRSPEDLFRIWRDFENLPRIMSHLESVRLIDDRRSHWAVAAPGIVGGRMEWDAEIISEQRDELIAWRSLPGADVDNVGQVTFERFPGDRGTLVRVSISYLPPAGRAGKWVADLFGKGPTRQVREDLRSFKRSMELGEAPTTIGQAHGTCTGQAARLTE